MTQLIRITDETDAPAYHVIDTDTSEVIGLVRQRYGLWLLTTPDTDELAADWSLQRLATRAPHILRRKAPPPHDDDMSVSYEEAQEIAAIEDRLCRCDGDDDTACLPHNPEYHSMKGVELYHQRYGA